MVSARYDSSCDPALMRLSPFGTELSTEQPTKSQIRPAVNHPLHRKTLFGTQNFGYSATVVCWGESTKRGLVHACGKPVYYLFLLVHSLWGKLWIQKMFAQPQVFDLRKRQTAGVDEKFFIQSFIHSLHLGLWGKPPAGRHRNGKTATRTMPSVLSPFISTPAAAPPLCKPRNMLWITAIWHKL